MKKARTLTDLFGHDAMDSLMGAHDALSAWIVEECSFPGFYGRYAPFGLPGQIGAHFPGGDPRIAFQKEEYGRYDRAMGFRIGEVASR